MMLALPIPQNVMIKRHALELTTSFIIPLVRLGCTVILLDDQNYYMYNDIILLLFILVYIGAVPCQLDATEERCFSMEGKYKYTTLCPIISSLYVFSYWCMSRAYRLLALSMYSYMYVYVC